MKQTLLIVAVSIGLILCAVGYSDSKYHTSAGRKIPDFYAENDSCRISAEAIKGSYALLNFWSSADAKSRTAANEYTAWQRRNPDCGVLLVSLNFDKNEKLFREVVKLDSLFPSGQFHVSGDTARAIIDNYGLKDGFGSLLVAPDGRIIAHNPCVDDIAGLIR